MLHLAFLVVAGGCLIAAWWQVHRAMAGNTLSYLYSVEWPAFAVVAGIGWWQMFHDTPEDIAGPQGASRPGPGRQCRGGGSHPAPVGSGHHRGVGGGRRRPRPRSR